MPPAFVILRRHAIDCSRADAGQDGVPAGCRMRLVGVVGSIGAVGDVAHDGVCTVVRQGVGERRVIRA